MPDVNELTEEHAIKLAIDAIRNDPRSTPYGHHQWDRARAERTLRRMLAEVSDASARA